MLDLVVRLQELDRLPAAGRRRGSGGPLSLGRPHPSWDQGGPALYGPPTGDWHAPPGLNVALQLLGCPCPLCKAASSCPALLLHAKRDPPSQQLSESSTSSDSKAVHSTSCQDTPVMVTSFILNVAAVGVHVPSRDRVPGATCSWQTAGWGGGGAMGGCQRACWVDGVGGCSRLHARHCSHPLPSCARISRGAVSSIIIISSSSAGDPRGARRAAISPTATAGGGSLVAAAGVKTLMAGEGAAPESSHEVPGSGVL
jgi:hypothetical protein